MKQHITIEQQNELSDKAHHKLAIWCLKNIPNGEIHWGQHKGECRGGANLHEYLLSIGQMIEFLDENNTKLDFHRFSKNEWLIQDFTNPIPEGRIWHDSSWINEELCDALWEAVKKVLESK